MNTVKKVCKVCGKTYTVCCVRQPNEALRWRDVACCPEHAEQYFMEIARSRGEVKDEIKDETPVTEVFGYDFSDVDEDDMPFVDDDDDISDPYEPEE